MIATGVMPLMLSPDGPSREVLVVGAAAGMASVRPDVRVAAGPQGGGPRGGGPADVGVLPVLDCWWRPAGPSRGLETLCSAVLTALQGEASR